MNLISKLKLAAMILSVVCILQVTAHAEAPSFSWAKSASGPGTDYGAVITTDSSGNTFVAGHYESNSISFGSVALTNGNIFVAKYDANGTALWAKPITVNGLGSICIGTLFYRLGCDANGNLYLGGSFANNPLSIDGTVFTNRTPAWTWSIFLVKFSPSGTQEWATSTQEADDIYSRAFAVDAEGNCYMGGNYQSAPSLGLTNIPDRLGLYVAQFDNTGSNVWARSIANVEPFSGRTYPTAIALGTNGGYALKGEYSSPTLNLGSVVLTNEFSPKWKFFLAQYDAEGGLQWAKTFGGIYTYGELGVGFSYDAQGNLYFTGDSEGAPITIDSVSYTNSGGFVMKLNPSGAVTWFKSITGSKYSPTSQAFSYINRAATDPSGNTFLFGLFSGTLTLGNFSATNDNAYLYKHFLAKCDANGEFLWGKAFCFNNGDVGCETARSANFKPDIAVDSSGNCSITGSYIVNTPFDSFTLSLNGPEDGFVARIEAECPRLGIQRVGSDVIVTWPANQNGYVLESATSLSGSWSAVTNSVSVVNSANTVTNQINPSGQFYRLRKF